MGRLDEGEYDPGRYFHIGDHLPVLRDKISAGMRTILESSWESRKPQPDRTNRKSGEFLFELQNHRPDRRRGEQSHLLPISHTLRTSRDRKGLDSEVARLHRRITTSLWIWRGSPDFKNSSQMIAMANQGDLGMPDRDYYLRDDEKSKNQLREG